MARPRTTTPTKPDDARALRSIGLLQSAFLDLLETRPIEQIAIKDITEAAGLSYPTFFRRFASKEDLLELIAKGEVQELFRLSHAAIAQGRPYEAPVAMCAFIEGRRKLWSVLLNGGASATMREEFMRASREIAETGTRSNPWIPAELAVPFVTSGIFEIFAWWMRQDEDYPTARVVKLFNALIVDNAGRPRDISID